MSASPAIHQLLLFVLEGKDPMKLSKEEENKLKGKDQKDLDSNEYLFIPDTKENNPLKSLAGIIKNPKAGLNEANSGKSSFYREFIDQLRDGLD